MGNYFRLTCRGYCVNKSDTTILTEVNGLIGKLCGNGAYDPENTSASFSRGDGGGNLAYVACRVVSYCVVNGFKRYGFACAVSALTIAATALSLSACGSTAKKLKVLNVTLTGEQYGYCVNKSDTTILTEVKRVCPVGNYFRLTRRGAGGKFRKYGCAGGMRL